jgi:hypothetical protein
MARARKELSSKRIPGRGRRRYSISNKTKTRRSGARIRPSWVSSRVWCRVAGAASSAISRSPAVVTGQLVDCNLPSMSGCKRGGMRLSTTRLSRMVPNMRDVCGRPPLTLKLAWIMRNPASSRIHPPQRWLTSTEGRESRRSAARMP